MATRNADKLKVAQICLAATHEQIDPVAQEQMISAEGVGKERASPGPTLAADSQNIRVRIDCNPPRN